MRYLLLILLLSANLTACNAGNALASLRRQTATPTVTSTPTFTPAPTITPTPTPTPTPAPAARVVLGDQALQYGDWESALAEYQNALESSQESGIREAAQLGISKTHLLSGKIDQAATSLEQFIQDNPDGSQAATAYFLLAQAYTSMEEYAKAAQAYTEYLNRRPGLIDAYIMDFRGDARLAAGDYLAAAQDYQTAEQLPGLLDATLLQMKTARAYALGGETQTALALYDEIYASTSNEYTRALIDLRKGQIYTALGQLDQAYAVYQDAVNNYPTSYDSYSALVTLVDADIPVNELSRGLVDYFAGQYGAALAALDRYLQQNPADPATALYYSGLANRALGGFEAAIEQWDKLIANYPDHPNWDKAWEEKAHTLWNNLNQHPQAVQTLREFASQYPAHPRAAEFLFDAGLIAELDGDLGQAAGIFEEVINLYPEDERAQRALFLAGISRYRQGDYAGAFLSFERLGGIATNLGDRAMAYFWIGKAQQKLGDPAAARVSFETAADLDPTGYYSERAFDLLRQRSPFTPPQAYDFAYDVEREQQKAESWLRQTFDLPENSDFSGLGELANDPRLARGKELWVLGDFEQGRAEFEALRQAVENDPVLTYQLARYFSEIGLYRSATLAARQVLTLAGMDDTQTMNAPAYFNRLRFGTYFKDIVIPIAEQYQIHPLLLFSIIRQESLFESFVRSSATARGLMQIMPATGAEIARNLGWPEDYITEDLNRPVINITLGAEYFDKQRNAFDGDIYAALAAYNGGPGNALAWLKLADGDPDLFLEIIRFKETRDYIRLIYEIFNIYRRIYDRSP